ncbi:MAG TPA: polysaccharide deacetylase family protein [Terriglobales bacterium]|nr:polysaccharide deacetylase family protein [Terriglobales bacterium]
MLEAAIGGVVALGGAAGAVSYGAVSPSSQLFGKTFVAAGAGSRQLALTFDDGPNDPHTLRLLEVLAKHGVKATFFMIGRFVRERPEIARAVAQAGHVIGNHTYTHSNLFFASGAQLARELDTCERALTDAVGEHSKLFRPPWGLRRPGTLRAAARRGLTTVMWSVPGNDWKLPTPEAIEGRVARHVRGGDVILLHDGGHWHMGVDRAPTVAATEQLISRYQADGFRFITIPELMQESANRGGAEAQR